MGNILYNTIGIKPRACIVFNRNIEFLPVPELCADDLVAAYVNLKGWKGQRVIICSAYLPGDKVNPAADLEAVVDYARRHNAELLVGCDANAHHTNWGSTDINDRGELLHDFLLTNCLQILNLGCEPTFVTRVRKEVLDITFATSNLARHIESWKVSEVESLSDHRHICFNVAFSLSVQTLTFRDPRRTDWEGYRSSLEHNLDSAGKSVRSRESLELAVEVVSKGIVQAFEDNCPPKVKTTKRLVPWWNSKLKRLRDKTRKLFNRAKRTDEWEIYRKALNEYSKQIRKAKRASWRKFCEEVNSTPQGARLHRLLSKAKPNQIGLLRRQDGSFTANEEETLKLLANTHFPGAAVSGGSSVGSDPHRPRPEDWRQAAIVIRPGFVRWAINSFRPYKAAGLDGVSPVLLQRGADVLIPLLVKIFRASYAWGHVPEQWNKVKILFIPKAGKKDYALAKSFRPISLSSFLLKTLEKVIDRYIRESSLINTPIHDSQHAYRRGRSTETALLELVDRVEKALEDKEIALSAFLDIEGAFDNTPIRTLVGGLKLKSVDPTTVRWVENMLSNRVAKLELLNTTLEVSTTRGCPQGGVLSPLLWTLAVDELLHKMADLRVDTQGYADDLVVTIRGNCQSTLSYLMQKALDAINLWCGEHELSVNADKTVVVPFTNKRKLDQLRPLVMNGKTITFSSEVKYLGVTLDQKLTWNPHLNGILQKAKSALAICCRLAGNRWGLQPKIALWLYTAIVRPMVSYASVAWYRKTTQKTTIARLGSLQRTACVIVTGAMSTSPTAALEAMLNLPPLNLHLEKEARSSMLRILTARKGNWLSRALTTLGESVNDVPVLGMPLDTIPPKLSTQINYSVELLKREDWTNSLIKWKPGSLKWYTDGSKSGSEVGCGVYGEAPKKAISLNLGRHSSIFQAEVYAILECATANLQSNYHNCTIYIHSDSQAALSALSSDVITSKLVENCRQILNTLAVKNKVILRWVPGHAGIEGNEKADELARRGAKETLCGPEPFCGIPSSLTKLTLKTYCFYKTIQAWRQIPGLNHSKVLIRAFSKKASTDALALSRNRLRMLTRVLTGHCGLNKHMHTLGLSDTRRCRFCQESDETPAHILTDCPCLMRSRNSILGKHIMCPEEIKFLEFSKILHFFEFAGLDQEL